MKQKQILNWVGLVVVLAMNGLATALPLGGKTTAEISDSIPTLFTPAGYVFSIWGLIYLGLLAFAWYQSRSQERESVVERIGYWFVASCAFNSIWIVLWHYEQVSLSLVAMLGLLVSLIAVYLRLDIGRRPVSASEKRWVHLPFSIYLGWISVATIANVSAVLYTLGWSGGPLSPEAWTAIMVSVAAVLGLVMIKLRNEVAFPLVLVWALIGIAVARASIWSVAITAGIAAVALVAMMVIAQLRGRR
jgi:benzodiazapine receptor